MRGVDTGNDMYRTVMTSHTITDVLCQFKGSWLLILQNIAFSMKDKKAGVYFEGVPVTKTQEHSRPQIFSFQLFATFSAVLKSVHTKFFDIPLEVAKKFVE